MYMPVNILIALLLFVSTIALNACKSAGRLTSSNTSTTESTQGLKDYYKNYFAIGVAVSPRALKTDEANLILHNSAA